MMNTRLVLGLHHDYYWIAPQLHVACTRVAQGLCQGCNQIAAGFFVRFSMARPAKRSKGQRTTDTFDRLIPGWYQDCTRVAPGLQQDRSYQGCVRFMIGLYHDYTRAENIDKT